MNAYEMMTKIAATLGENEKITVHVAHSGKWNGAHIFEVTNKGYKYVKHVWRSHGDVRAIYKERVIIK